MTRLLLLCLTTCSLTALAQDLDAGVAEGAAPVEAPPPAPAPPAPVPASPPPAPMLLTLMSKFQTSMYGFVEFDLIADTTQSFNDQAANGAIARPETLAGKNGRLMFGVRNSRIGFKVAAPPVGVLKTSAVLEMDFLGNQPPGISEAAFFTNPGFRIRHFAIKLETPWLDVLVGQSWQLFGWQPYFHHNSVEIQGVPGQVYSRAPQLRLSHAFKGDAVTFELAVAATRPPERDSFVPDGQAGARLLFNRWKGLRTGGSTGTSVDAAGLGVSGVIRQFAIPEFTASPKTLVNTQGWGLSLDALLPIIPATADDRANALTLTASFVRGEGIADLYSGLSGGVSLPALPNPTGASPAPTYANTLDNGLVSFDSAAIPHPIAWQTFIVGLQYYLPPTGKVWLSANFSESNSINAKLFGGPTKVFTRGYWADLNAFIDLTPAVRFGAEYAWFNQTYQDGTAATNHRVQVSAFYLF